MSILLYMILSGPIYRDCDLVEVNHVINTETEEEAFVQVILWDWNPEYRRFDVQGWIMIDGTEIDYQKKIVSVKGTINTKSIYYRYKYFRETWTTYDREIRQRSMFPVNKRRWN